MPGFAVSVSFLTASHFENWFFNLCHEGGGICSVVSATLLLHIWLCSDSSRSSCDHVRPLCRNQIKDLVQHFIRIPAPDCNCSQGSKWVIHFMQSVLSFTEALQRYRMDAGSSAVSFWKPEPCNYRTLTNYPPHGYPSQYLIYVPLFFALSLSANF